MTSEVKITGFRELHDALGAFKKSTERALLRRVVKRALQPVVDDARALAPEDEGNLRESIVIGTKLTKSARAEARKDPSHGVRLYAGTSDRAAILNEFGTVNMRASPFMGPAWYANEAGMLESIKADLTQEIERTAARVKKGK